MVIIGYSKKKMKILRRHISILTSVLTMVLTGTGCSSDETSLPAGTDGHAVAVGIAVDELPWQVSQVSVTRSGETLEGLKTASSPVAAGEGFGLYSTRLNLTNQQVTWESSSAKWDYGTTLLWPDNVVKYSVSFNGSMTESKEGKFTLGGTYSYNTKFTGCTYQGINFTQGLKMEAGSDNPATPATISWSSGAVGSNKTKVTIVQSRWGNKTIKFDGAELDSTDAKICTMIPGGRVYTLKNVAQGNHTITRGNGESGIFYVSVDVDICAYAPYNASPGFTEPSKISFTPSDVTPVDLLWAEDSVSTDGTVHLNFRHALAKVSFGKFTNNYGCNVTLKSISLTGTLATSGTLSLADGSWSGLTTESATISRNSINQDISDGEIFTNTGSISKILLIPGPTATITVTINSTKYGDENIVFDVTLEQGKNKSIDLSIGHNHEVIIQ